MDLSMPRMNGYECTYNIRKFYRQNNLLQPMIVACTGHSEDKYIMQAWRYQIDEVIFKPAKLEVIKCLLDEMVEQ